MPLTESVNLVLANGFTWNETVWNPSMIQTALWLDANDSATVIQSGGAVTSWRDKSGNGRHATADGNPTYSATGMSTSKPAVQLDGTGDAFVSSITGIGSFNALDVYMVVQSTAAAAANTNSALFWGYGNASNGTAPYNVNGFVGATSSATVLTGETITANLFSSAFDNGRLGSTTYSRAANTAQLLQTTFATTGISFRSSGSLVTLDLANQITTSTNAAPSSISYSVDSNLYIGAIRSVGVLTYTPGLKFAEFIVLSTTANADIRQRIEGYLAHKWGLTANLPAGHPYKTVGPTP